jgi:hypothetical protein
MRSKAMLFCVFSSAFLAATLNAAAPLDRQLRPNFQSEPAPSHHP